MQISVKLLEHNEEKYSLSDEEIKKRKKRISENNADVLDGVDRMRARRKMLSNVAAEPLEAAFERYIGNIDLVPINYLQIGYTKSKAVGRIRFVDVKTGRNALATGFLISNDLVLTNHHVFNDANSFRDAFIEFDYAFDADGNEKTKVVFALSPQKFFSAEQSLDYAVVGINPVDEKNEHKITERGFLVLNRDTGKAGLGDCATIIQYPEGNWQQISLRDNKIIDIENPNALIYVSDTAPGSSGSPVFNDQWQVIALHSAGVAKKNARGEYIDKDNKVIPLAADGSVDASRIEWVSNTGIRVSALFKNLVEKPANTKNPYIKFLTSPNYSDRKSLSSISKPIADKESNPDIPVNFSPVINSNTMPDKPIVIAGNGAAPAPVSINIYIGNQPPIVANIPGNQNTMALAAENFETKADDELNADYSDCQGFDEFFLPVKTPLPELSAQLKKKVAHLTDNPKQYILKYYHYSTAVHSIRRMPIFSAININGSPAKRKDNAARKDKWMRDNRIDMDVQLNDPFYATSGFDKGHMSRREDANWGNNAAEAERDANVTCMYTNACPQVPALNRAIYGYHGLWGQLEQIVLEKGVTLEKGDTGKICVYNGPVFDDTNPVFKSVQIPMQFWKIIVWQNAEKKFKTTGFIMSQADLVGDIQFEELQFDKEFIEHQCSIAYIEKLTGLKFTGIRENDTYTKTGVKDKGVKTIDVTSLNTLIDKHKGKKKTKTGK